MKRKLLLTIAAVALCAIVFVLWRATVQPKLIQPTDATITKGEIVQEPILYQALSAAGQAAYDTLLQRIQSQTPGMVVFPAGITMAEFQKVQNCLLIEAPQSVAARPLYPMTDENVCMALEQEEGAAEEEKVQQCLLWIYGSALTPDDVVIEDNQIKNVEQCVALLQEYDPTMVEALQQQADAADAKLDQVVDALPETFSQLEAVRQFVAWEIEHLNPAETPRDFANFNAVVTTYHIPSSILCAETGRGLCVGYAKVFQALCTKAGIPCEIVYGFRVYNDEGHAINRLHFGSEVYYLDTSDARSADQIRYIKEEDLAQHLRATSVE